MVRCNKCGKKISKGQYYCIFCGAINENNRCHKIDSNNLEVDDGGSEDKFSLNRLCSDIHSFPKNNKRQIVTILVSLAVFLISLVFQLLNIDLDGDLSFVKLLYSLPTLFILFFLIMGCIFYYDRYSTLGENVSRCFVTLFILFTVTFPWVIQNSVYNPHMLVVIFLVISVALVIFVTYFLLKKFLWYVIRILKCDNFIVFVSVFLSISYVFMNLVYLFFKLR